MTERIGSAGARPERPDGIETLRALSAGGFARLGLGIVAYVRPTAIDGQRVFAVHAADGAPIAVAATRELAQAVALQNDLQLLTVH
ncbi:MAG: DUF1150 family protein [Alphaproteobacteria bacterium]